MKKTKIKNLTRAVILILLLSLMLPFVAGCNEPKEPTDSSSPESSSEPTVESPSSSKSETPPETPAETPIETTPTEPDYGEPTDRELELLSIWNSNIANSEIEFESVKIGKHYRVEGELGHSIEFRTTTDEAIIARVLNALRVQEIRMKVPEEIHPNGHCYYIQFTTKDGQFDYALAFYKNDNALYFQEYLEDMGGWLYLCRVIADIKYESIEEIFDSIETDS